LASSTSISAFSSVIGKDVVYPIAFIEKSPSA
jgi:hypothetical protein